MLTLDEIIIDRRFRGPPDSGNGGYVGGYLASFLDGPAEVTLRLPPPLDTPLQVVQSKSGTLELRNGEQSVAYAVRTELDLEPPKVSYEDAVRAVRSAENHPFPMCFVCGPERTDGLGILPGPVAGKEMIAAPWTPGRDLAVAQRVLPQFVWAALDCPGGLAWLDAAEGHPFVLGRLAVRLASPVVVGERYIAVGWKVGRDGRKLFSRTALMHISGRVCGVGAATWFLMQN
ncbi:MAG: hypothetical protein KGK07_09580 [Chloroflexota bacterium]|nr:hypothetical protein [Chloroflexota bacterium]